jgi:hypothetical protein
MTNKIIHQIRQALIENSDEKTSNEKRIISEIKPEWNLSQCFS